MERILKHADHNLTQEHINFGFSKILETLENGQPFCVNTFLLPDNLPDTENALYGPMVGDKPILDSEVTLQRRGDRPWKDRLINKPKRPSRVLTVIGGIIDGKLTAFTMHGGPLANQNPEDPSSKTPEEDKAFWAEHALAM